MLTSECVSGAEVTLWVSGWSSGDEVATLTSGWSSAGETTLKNSASSIVQWSILLFFALRHLSLPLPAPRSSLRSRRHPKPCFCLRLSSRPTTLCLHLSMLTWPTKFCSRLRLLPWPTKLSQIRWKTMLSLPAQLRTSLCHPVPPRTSICLAVPLRTLLCLPASPSMSPIGSEIHGNFYIWFHSLFY